MDEQGMTIVKMRVLAVEEAEGVDICLANGEGMIVSAETAAKYQVGDLFNMAAVPRFDLAAHRARRNPVEDAMFAAKEKRKREVAERSTGLIRGHAAFFRIRGKAEELWVLALAEKENELLSLKRQLSESKARVAELEEKLKP